MKNRKKVAIPHLTGGINNKLNQLIEFSESLNHPVFMDSKGNHLTPNEIVMIYEEDQTANDKKPVTYIYCIPNNEELARRNPAAKMSKKKTNAREKYMANLLGGKNGNDLLNLASKVGSRKAAVELLKSGNTRSPFNVEIPLSDEDEIQALAMQGLTPSNEALVDQAYRNKLENQIVSYLGTKQDLATIDKGAIVTDELISDFRQMLTVYHLTHMMNGPLANSIKGHVPRSKSHVFDRLIPSFDDILAGENLVIFASTIVKKPKAKYTQFTMPESTTTLLPPWLDLVIDDDEALKELKDSLGGRRAEKAIELLAAGDFVGFLQQLGTNTANLFESQLRFFLRIRPEVRDNDRQARLFDDLVENITAALVSEFGRGRGYTNRKELAKAVVHATDEAYDRRLTDVFAPLKITVNAARRVRRFSPSGATMKLGLNFQTLESSEGQKGSPIGVISPGMFYIGNYDFQTPPIGWNRKWMVATAQIIHEYWNYIRPSGEATANNAFMPEKGDMSLSLPQILYLIAIRTKELYNYDLAPEEWLILIQVLGGQNALKENYYQANRDGITKDLDALIYKIEQDLLVQREAVKQAIEDSRNAPRRTRPGSPREGGARRNPSKSALPQVFSKKDKILSMEERLENRVAALKEQYKEIRELSQDHLETVEKARDRHAEDKKRLSGVMKSWKKYQDKYEASAKEVEDWKKKANNLKKNMKKLEDARLAVLSGSKGEKLTDLVGATLVKSLKSNSLKIGIDGLKDIINDLNIPLVDGKDVNDYKGQVGKAALHQIIMDHFESVDTGTLEASKVLDTMEDIAIDGDKEIIEDALEEIVEEDKSMLSAAKEVLSKAAERKKKRKERKKRKKAEGKSPEEVSDFAEAFETFKEGDEKKEKEVETKSKSGWLMNYEDRRDEDNTFVVNLKPKGKIGVVFDTHADWKANMEIIEHMESNHGELNHVLWAGDCFDAGRGSLDYTPGEDDIKNWDFIQSLIERDEDKYIFLSGNHEQPDLASFDGSFWEWAKENGVYDDYTQETANLPFMARAGPVMICHGGFPVPVLVDPPKPKYRFWNDPGVWTKTVQLHTIWTRPSSGPDWNMTTKRTDAGEELSDLTGTMMKKAGDIYSEPKTEDEWRQWTKRMTDQYSLNEEFEFAMARFGINTMITAHTPSINYGVIGKPAYESESFLHISGQSARDITRRPIYAIVDFDTQEITIEIADAGIISPYPLDDSITALTWVETAKEKLPKMILDTEGVPKEYEYKRNPPGDYHEYEEDVIDVLIDEGGAAGLSALRPAFPPKTTKTQARNMLKQMNSVVLHKEGDYILVRGINNPRSWDLISRKSIEGTPIQPFPGPKGEMCSGCSYLCPESYQCKLWTEKEGRAVFVNDDYYCKGYEARPKKNKPIGGIEFVAGMSLLGGIAVAGKFIGPYVSHLLAKHREKKLSEKIVGEIVGEIKPLIEKMNQKNEEAVAYTVAKQMTPQQVKQLEELQDEIGDEIEPEVEEFFDEIIEQSEVQVRYHIIETPHGTYKYDEEYLMMEVPVGDDDKVMSWIENNMQDDNPNLYHDVTIEGDTATYKLKKKARRNAPFDMAKTRDVMESDALKKLEQFAKDYLDGELKRKMVAGDVIKRTPNQKGVSKTAYRIDIDERNGGSEILNILNMINPTAWPRNYAELRYVPHLHKKRRTIIAKIGKHLSPLYNGNVEFDLDWGGFPANPSFVFFFELPQGRKPKPKKNPQLPACSYRKSKRSKACGGKLRAKKNPKGRIVCTDCGAEYEMR